MAITTDVPYRTIVISVNVGEIRVNENSAGDSYPI